MLEMRIMHWLFTFSLLLCQLYHIVWKEWIAAVFQSRPVRDPGSDCKDGPTFKCLCHFVETLKEPTRLQPKTHIFLFDRNGLSETICLHLDVEYEDADDKNCVATFNCQLPAAGKLKAGCYCRAKSLALAIGPFHHFHQWGPTNYTFNIPKVTLNNAMIALAFGLFLDQYRPLVKIDHPLNLWLSQTAKSGSSVIFKVKHGKDKGTEKVQTKNIS